MTPPQEFVLTAQVLQRLEARDTSIQKAIEASEGRISQRLQAVGDELRDMRGDISALKEDRIQAAVVEQRLTHAEQELSSLRVEVGEVDRRLDDALRDFAELKAEVKAIRDEQAARREQMMKYGKQGGGVAGIASLIIYLLYALGVFGPNVQPPPDVSEPPERQAPVAPDVDATP